MSQKTPVILHFDEGRSSNLTQLEAVNTNTTKRRQLVSRLKRGKEYRDLFVENEIAVGIPIQIRAMRDKKNWTQKELGERTGKRQSVISQLENPGYGKLTLSTLKTLASAFDVGLMVRFVPFSELISRAANLSEDDVSVQSFSDDEQLLPIQRDTKSEQIQKIWRDHIRPKSRAQLDDSPYQAKNIVLSDGINNDNDYRTDTATSQCSYTYCTTNNNPDVLRK